MPTTLSSFLRRSSDQIDNSKMLSPYLGAAVLCLVWTGLVPSDHFVHLVLCIFLVGCFETTRFFSSSKVACSPLILISSLVGHSLLLLPFLGQTPSSLSLPVCLSVLSSCLLFLWVSDSWPYASTPVEVASLCISFLVLSSGWGGEGTGAETRGGGGEKGRGG